MPDFLTPTERSDVMRRVRSAGTTPELALRRALRRAGLRPQPNRADLPGKPDVVFRRARLACFVDGELWHGGQWRRRGLDRPDQQFAGAANRDYWVRKVHRNIERDLRNTARLLRDGWTVLRVWARDVERDPDAVAEQIRALKAGELRPPPLQPAALATVAEFFAGIGLMREGVGAAGWSTVWANDHDPMKRRLYLHNLGAERVELDDRSIQDVPDGAVPAAGLFTASFPCTDLSLAGGRAGIERGEQSSAFLSFADILDRMGPRRPTFVLLENVTALVSSHGGRDLRLCLDRLAGAGYAVDTMAVDARHFVPQSRPRLFIVGVRADADVPPHRPAEDVGPPTATRPERLVEFIRANPDLPWRLAHLPDLPTPDARLEDLLEDLPEGDGAWWSDARVERFRAQVSDRHLDAVERGLARDGEVWATAFRRMRRGRSMAELRFDGVAGCLRTPKGGSAKQILLHATPDRWRVRLLTPRECARLMGVGGFRLDAEGVGPNDALFGFGDAVVAPVVEWVVRHAINPVAAELIRGVPLRAPDDAAGQGRLF
jgi:DNA (cytosine-5)-methyltransferase 1